MPVIRRAWVCALIVTTLGGCSVLRLGYDQAEPLVRWWFDRQLDLTAEQSRWLKDALRRFHAWHRQAQLPAYAETVALMSRQSMDEVSPAQVCEHIDAAIAQTDVLLRQAAPLMAGLARQLDTAQLQHLRRRFADEDREWREKWLDLSAEKRIKQRQDDWADRAESIYGRLSREQRDFIRQSVIRSSWEPQLSWERRQLRQQEILATLEKIMRQRLPQPDAEGEILALIERSMRPDIPRFMDMQRKLQLEACANLSGLHRLTTPAQRLKARDKLAAYAEDFRQLSVAR